MGNPTPASLIVDATSDLGRAALIAFLSGQNPDGSTFTYNTTEVTGLVPKVFDYIALSYTGSDLTGVVYKTGGSGGTTVATLALTYSSSVLQTVTRT